jgi:hypothetical protein
LSDPKQITDPAELAGKTIERIVGLESDSRQWGLMFADGTFAFIGLGRYRRGYNSFSTLRLEDCADDADLLELGVITLEQYEQKEAACLEAMKAERAREEAEKLAKTEETERQALATLLAKYGNPS